MASDNQNRVCQHIGIYHDFSFAMKINLTSLTLGLWLGAFTATAADPLPSWNDTAPKKVIIAFVEKVTREGSPDFVSVPERIATFDNDGRLWAEQPIYVQLRFALDRVKALAPEHPEWKTKQPFQKLLSTPGEQNVAVSEAGLMESIMVS